MIPNSEMDKILDNILEINYSKSEMLNLLMMQHNEMIKLRKRIYEAIEYIEKHIVATETENILLDILKGDDKE